MPGIEPGAFHMQSERATTALHPLPCATDFSIFNLKIDLFMAGGLKTAAEMVDFYR